MIEGLYHSVFYECPSFRREKEEVKELSANNERRKVYIYETCLQFALILSFALGGLNGPFAEALRARNAERLPRRTEGP